MAEERIRDYIVEGLIGRGGMGSVYLASHVHLGTKAALKVLLEQYSDDPTIKNRFINEARLLHELRHPNVVEQREFFEENGRLVLVMEYVDGRGLDRMIGHEVGPIPWEKALPLFIQILDGIGYAHSKGIIHRDIKPANILVSKDGKVKITDLGIAKIAGQKGMTRTGTQMGTLYYESPEQIKGAKDVDQRSDIYSLGMTLYEMLAGRLPFDDAGDTSEFQIMNSIVNRETHLDPRKYYPHIPEWLVEVVQKATNLNPEKRFQSCEVFKRVLEKHGNLSVSESGYWSVRVASAAQAPLSVSKLISTGSSSSVSSEDRCPKCSSSIEKEMEFCMKCGTDLQKNCPACDKKIRWFAEFCPKCGTNIGEKLASIVAQSMPLAQSAAPLPGMNFVKIPGGSFMMGSPPEEKDHSDSESPVHRVSVKPFELLSTPVTQGIWQSVMGKNPSCFQGENNPVETVSWEDCQKFIDNLNKKKGLSHTYRLPSEAEWEYACRAGTTTRFYWGSIDSKSTIGQYCWYDGNSNNTTHPVGQKLPNAWGLYDMSGNVWEWCEDEYSKSYSGAPTDGSPWVSPSGSYRVFRGGGWCNGAGFCRSADRALFSPVNRDNDLGFRLARSVR
jgi:formylglycine-generating enzyme required for sulfatase activity/predicted Ser/Thr protein kinase